jgi:hypothetical protein
MGTNISVARLSSVAASFSLVDLSGKNGENLFLPVFFGAIMCFISWLSACFLALLDKRADLK